MATRKNDGFTAEERSAMKERAAELKSSATRGTGTKKAQADAQDCLDKIKEMSGTDREVAETLHRVVGKHAPDLSAKTWYGMPAYAGDGKVVVFFQPGAKFGTRYSTLGFQDAARLDDGSIWATSYAVTDDDAATRASVAALVRKAAGL